MIIAQISSRLACNFIGILRGNLSKIHNLSECFHWVPFWPWRHTGCIIKWVPAGVWWPGDWGENKACCSENTLTPPPPRCHIHPTLLTCQVMIWELRASLCLIWHTGETQCCTGSSTADWKSPANKPVPWLETTILEICTNIPMHSLCNMNTCTI